MRPFLRETIVSFGDVSIEVCLLTHPEYVQFHLVRDNERNEDGSVTVRLIGEGGERAVSIEESAMNTYTYEIPEEDRDLYHRVIV